MLGFRAAPGDPAFDNRLAPAEMFADLLLPRQPVDQPVDARELVIEAGALARPVEEQVGAQRHRVGQDRIPVVANHPRPVDSCRAGLGRPDGDASGSPHPKPTMATQRRDLMSELRRERVDVVSGNVK